MRDINECRAEVFRRAENKIKERKRKRRRIFATCVPLCLIVVVLSVPMLAKMMSVDNENVAATGGQAAASRVTATLDAPDKPDTPEASGDYKGSHEALTSINFSFSLTWNVYGISSYDSSTGRLVKTTDATVPDDYITTLRLDDAKMLEIRKIIDDLDVESYPDEYDPFGDGSMSKPPMTLILSVKTEKFEKTISAERIAISYTSGDPKGQKFLDACCKIRDILIATDEWKALPEYEYFYD